MLSNHIIIEEFVSQLNFDLIFGVLTPLSAIFQLLKSHADSLLSCEGQGGSMSYVVGLPNNSYKPITNMAWVRARLCKLQERVHSTRSRK
jgi:hypothetical protein